MRRYLVWAIPTTFCLLAAFGLLIVKVRSGQDPPRFPQDLSKVEIKATHLAGNIHMLEGEGGNIGVSIGADGMLIVDDQFAPLADKIRAALKKLGDGKLEYVLNTHWHGDHTGGNTEFGSEATIIAHDNVRKRLSGEWKPQGRKPASPAPQHALPVITFDQSLSIYFNGEEIRVIHYPHGHTDGDSIIFFTSSNVVHMGDHFSNGLFPVIDLGGGGDVEGYTRNVEAAIAKIPADAKIIPGHGPLANTDDLKNFHQMLVATADIVRERMKGGRSLDQVRDQPLPEKWNSWGKGTVNMRSWIQTIYQSLSRQNRP